MANDSNSILSDNLFFLTSAFSRKLLKQADDACASVGLSSSHALILLLVHKNPGIQPGMLAEKMYLKPSTITRLVQKLERRELVHRESEGRTTSIVCTSNGDDMINQVKEIWHNLGKEIKEELGERYVSVLSEMILNAIEEV